MHTLENMAVVLNRSPACLRDLQRMFKLPVFTGPGYAKPYLAFLETVIALQTLNIPVKTIVTLWRIELKIMRLLHADASGSSTWFLDACAASRNRHRRLLLSHFDVGSALPSGAIQLELALGEDKEKLLANPRMGKAALAALQAYLEVYAAIRISVKAEIPRLFAALSASKRFVP